jgi:uncharacterized protein YyaL (SSP411 family)
MNPPNPTPSLAAQRAAEALSTAGKLHHWPEFDHKVQEVAQIIERETRVGELRKQLTDAAESFEAIGRDGNAHTMARLARFEAKSFRALLARLPSPPPTE